jgi:hypothetical protein
MERPASKFTATAASSSPLGLDAYVKDLNPCDVLLGRGTGPNEQTGNKYFREIVHQQKEAYFNKTSRKEKAEIVWSTIEQVKAKNGRFLKRLEKYEIKRLGLTGDTIYAIVGNDSAVEKTKQAFRYAIKKETNDADGPDDEDGDDGRDKTSRRAHKKTRIEPSDLTTGNNSPQANKAARSAYSVYAGAPTLQLLYPVTLNNLREQQPAILNQLPAFNRTTLAILGQNSVGVSSLIWPPELDPTVGTPLTLEALLARRRAIDAVASAAATEAMLHRALPLANTFLPSQFGSVPRSHNAALFQALAQLAAKDPYMGSMPSFPRGPPSY